MDLQDQLKNLFPDHEPTPEEAIEEVAHELYVQRTYDL
jgi:translation initiation factor 1